MNETTLQLSVAVGAVHVAICVHEPLVVKEIFPGHPLIIGFWLSITVTVNEHDVEFPDGSVAV